MIHQAAGRGDDDVDAGAERKLLLVHGHAAVDRDARDLRVIGEPLNLILDLHGELARRRQHEGASLRSARTFLEEQLEDRNEKRCRLSGAGLGAGDHVVAGKREAG